MFSAVAKFDNFRLLGKTIFDSSSLISLCNLVLACAEQEIDTYIWSTSDSMVNMGGSEVDFTSDISEDDVDDNAFSNTLDFELEPVVFGL